MFSQDMEENQFLAYIEKFDHGKGFEFGPENIQTWIWCLVGLWVSPNENVVSILGFLGGSLVIAGAAPVTLLGEAQERENSGSGR